MRILAKRSISILTLLVLECRKNKPFVSLGKNPAQNPFLNLGAEAVTRGVGGMTTHWTCATPELNPYIERPVLDPDSAKNDQLWAALYNEARALIGTSEKEFDQSIRHQLVLQTYQRNHAGKRVFKPLPLACHRLDDPEYVEWHATDRILETLFTDPVKRAKFTLLTNHRCTRVIPTHFNPDQPNEVGYAEVQSLLPRTEGRKGSSTFAVRAKIYVIACGAVGSAQVMFNIPFQRRLYGLTLGYRCLLTPTSTPRPKVPSMTRTAI